MLGRANLYTFDEEGNKFRRKHAVDDPGCTGCGTGEWRCMRTQGGCCPECWHPNETPIHETPRHALSRGLGLDVDDSREQAQKDAADRWNTLTEEEKQVLELERGLIERVYERFEILAGDLVAYQRKGYSLIPGTQRMAERAGGLAPIETVEVNGYEYRQTEGLNYEQVAARMGKTWRQVKRITLEARKKLRTGPQAK